VGQAFGIAVRMTIHLPGMDPAQAQQLVDAAHQVCPYSNATRGNIDVTLTIA
jgi:organic hydroperoxide reductase OsmC/OhrA